jgi:hypothetical protein
VGGRGTVWTGHADGTVRAHHRGAWDAARLPAFRGAVRALAVDSKGQAWAGDEAGLIKVVRLDPRARAASVIWQALPEAPGGAPCAALLACGGCGVISAGGRAPGALTLWDAAKLAPAATADAGARGGICCAEALPWGDEDEAVAPAAGSGSRAVGGGGGWRLLTGMNTGQILLWEVGPAALRPATAIGPRGGGAVRCELDGRGARCGLGASPIAGVAGVALRGARPRSFAY